MQSQSRILELILKNIFRSILYYLKTLHNIHNPKQLDKTLYKPLTFKDLKNSVTLHNRFPCSTLPHSLLDSQKHIQVHLPFDVILQQVVKKVLNRAVSTVSPSVMEYANLGEGFIERLAQPFSFTYGDVLCDTVLLFLFGQVERNSCELVGKSESVSSENK